MTATRTTSFRLSPATHLALARLRDRLRLASQAAVISEAVATLERVLDAGEAAEAAEAELEQARRDIDMTVGLAGPSFAAGAEWMARARAAEAVRDRLRAALAEWASRDCDNHDGKLGGPTHCGTSGLPRGAWCYPCRARAVLVVEPGAGAGEGES